MIIAAFTTVPEERAREWAPTVVLVDDDNRITNGASVEVAGPQRRVAKG